MRNKYFEFNYYLMLMPGMLFLLIFSFIPMIGIIIAFEDFNPGLGIFKSTWVGLDNFLYMFQITDSRQVFINTIVIASLQVIAGLITPLAFALILNELRSIWFKRTIQTIVYIPHFLSWVILGGIIGNLLTLEGPINQIIHALGGEPILFLQSNFWFRPVLIITAQWKEFGFGTIIFLAAILAISPSLYESASMDGATRFQRLLHITLPSIMPTIILLSTLAIGRILDGGFDQIFNLYNPLVFETADIIDTYVYRAAFVSGQYGLGTAINLMKSLIGFFLIITSWKLAEKYANYRIF